MTGIELSARALDVEIGATRVVESLEFAARPGEVWGVLGPNGAGKTTLLMTLAGVRRQRAGSIFLGGASIETLPRRQVARRLGMLTQHTFYAFDASCLEIALSGRHPHLRPWDRERAEDYRMTKQALEQLGLDELAERSCMALSGGEARRLALATVLVQDPAVMLLDEPTNHLDPANQVQVMNLLWTLARDGEKTLVMAVHDVNLATCYCTHVLMLYGGGEYEAGPTAKLLEAERLSRLYRCPVRLVDDGSQRVFAVAGAPSMRTG